MTGQEAQETMNEMRYLIVTREDEERFYRLAIKLERGGNPEMAIELKRQYRAAMVRVGGG